MRRWGRTETLPCSWINQEDFLGGGVVEAEGQPDPLVGHERRLLADGAGQDGVDVDHVRERPRIHEGHDRRLGHPRHGAEGLAGGLVGVEEHVPVGRIGRGVDGGRLHGGHRSGFLGLAGIGVAAAACECDGRQEEDANGKKKSLGAHVALSLG